MIRDLTIDDLEKMTNLFISVFTEEPWSEDWDRSLAQERLELFLNHPKMVSKGFFENDKLLGFGLGNIQPYQRERYFYLEEMCVENSVQGKGVGTQLWESLEKELKLSSVSSMSFLTLKETPAERFYEKRGCVSCENVQFMIKNLK